MPPPQQERTFVSPVARCNVLHSLSLLAFSLVLLLASPSLSFLPPPGAAAGFAWGCPPCDNESLCSPPDCPESLQYVDDCGCCVLCARLEGERCGGVGNAGGRCNESVLHCAHRPGSIFGEERMGVCEHYQCRQKSCGYRQRCGFGMTEDGSTKTLCTCDRHLCDHKLNPLCGRDGQTYSSVCHLQLAECLSGSPIGILHFNHCEVVVHSSLDSVYNTSIQPSNRLYRTIQLLPTTTRCVYEDLLYSPFQIHPPSNLIPCTYYVCSDYGHMEQNPVLGCEGNPPEEDWMVDRAVVPASWSRWPPYSTCVGDCEQGGWANRTRTCTNPPPSTHPEAIPSALVCEGEMDDSKLCEPDGCRICHFTGWSEWTLCSTNTPCRTGHWSRKRKLTNTPTVPELCREIEQNRTCQFVPGCSTCGRRKTRSFRVINRRTGCFSRRFKSGILCAGRCAPGKCCRGIYNPFVQDPFIFTMECPDNPTRPHNVEFFQPSRCICKKCSKRHYYPQYFDRGWQIVW